MASTAKAGQTARQKARERRIALEAQTKERNDRIEDWTAAVFTGVQERDRALQAAAAAEEAMADGLIDLSGEGLTTSEVADLCELTTGEVQKLTKHRREATQPRTQQTHRGVDRESLPAVGDPTAAGRGPRAVTPEPVGGDDA
ncbi:MAG: hypothetical protein ACR2LF_13585 [Jatrophihabitantaceae bacterium]